MAEGRQEMSVGRSRNESGVRLMSYLGLFALHQLELVIDRRWRTIVSISQDLGGQVFGVMRFACMQSR
jgi:hypothetical protein